MLYPLGSLASSSHQQWQAAAVEHLGDHPASPRISGEAGAAGAEPNVGRHQRWRVLGDRI